jgi:hypothetical protein
MARPSWKSSDVKVSKQIRHVGVVCFLIDSFVDTIGGRLLTKAALLVSFSAADVEEVPSSKSAESIGCRSSCNVTTGMVVEEAEEVGEASRVGDKSSPLVCGSALAPLVNALLNQ